MPYKYAAFDIETTGLKPGNNSVVSIAAVKQTLNEGLKCEVFTVRETVLNPDTGEKRPRLEEEHRVISEFIQFLSDPVEDTEIWSYNGDRFDWHFLESRANLKDDFSKLMTDIRMLAVNYSVDLFIDYTKLEDAAEQHGIEHKGDIDGSMVEQFFKEDKLDEIESYVKEDVRVTFRLGEELRKEEGQK